MDKTISSMDVLFLAMGAMLGWGWVILSGEWVATAGFVGATLAFIIGGILITLIGLTYAELATAIPEAGGGVVFVQRAYNPSLAFIAGWSVLFGYMSVIAFEAVALPTVIDYIAPIEHKVKLWTLAGSDIYLTWAMIGSIGALFLGVLNYIGIRSATIFQTIFTLAIIGVGLLLIFGALSYGDSQNLHPLFTGGLSGMTNVLVMVPFMFVGFDVIPQIASEIRATKSIGKILVISIISALAFYILIIYGVSLGLPESELLTSKLATADAMTHLFNSPLLGKILVIGGIAGIITSWNAFVIGGSRILYAMALRNMLPTWFAKLHPKFRTPSNAILFLTALAFFAPLLGRQALGWLVNAGSIGVVLGYLIVTLAFIRLRKLEPELERPYEIRYPRLIGYTAVILSIGFLTLYLPGMPSALSFPIEWSLVLGWYLIGAWFLIIRKKPIPEVHFEGYRHLKNQ